MAKRFLTIWFRYLKTDWFTLRHPELKNKPFVLAFPGHGRMVVTGANHQALQEGISIGMALADARAITPSLQVLDDKPDLPANLLKALAAWFIRYTPLAAVDVPDGLILESTGCDHLWGGEEQYLESIMNRLQSHGYQVRAAMADTIGAAWAITHFGTGSAVIGCKEQSTALLHLPPAALRLELPVLERMHKLGLKYIGQFMGMPRSILRRRFSNGLIQRLDQALGLEEELMQPVQPLPVYQERLPCLEPIVTATGIEIALKRLLETLCHRLKQDEKGLRQACFTGYRMDGKLEKIGIGTNRPSHDHHHLFKLFESRLPGIEPALGIELFTLDISGVQDISPMQEELWKGTGGLDDMDLSQLIDRLANKIGAERIHRYLPAEHYWPERSVKRAFAFHEKTNTTWRNDKPRPIRLLTKPESVEVTSPLPDYPPMMFRYKNKLHKIIKADGPERIEPEWWLQEGPHRDYYCVEDDGGCRYWLFRSGHYEDNKPARWFIHGFFA